MRKWNKIRLGLAGVNVDEVRDAAVATGKMERGELPEDIADAILRLFTHPDPDVRAEAVRAIGVHWHLPRAVRAIANMLDPDEDSSVQLYAVGGLGAIGVEHEDSRCFASKTIAGVILNDRFGDFERRVAYLKLLLVERRIDFEEYIRLDREIPDTIEALDWDRPWVEELAQRDCP